MPNCPKCGLPLYQGNVQVIRRPRKRNKREHRKCPEKPKTNRLIVPGGPVQGPPPTVGGNTGDGLQRPQDTTGGPLAGEVVFFDYPPIRFRYFMTREQAERVKAAMGRRLPWVGVSFEVIPVAEDEVDREPDRYSDLVEVKVDWNEE